MLFGLLLLHLLCGTAALAAGRRLRRYVWVVGAVAPAATVLWLIVNRTRTAGDGVTARADWVPSLGLTIDLRVDSFAALMIVLVAGIGVAVHAYAWHYFGNAAVVGKAAGLLTLFAGSMLGVVVADNLLLLYLFWELTSITSYLLIGLDDADGEARAAAQHALLVTAMGGLAMLGGFVLVGRAAGTFRISAIVANPPGGTATTVALVLILLGAFTKSGQYPFHSWLPGAMVAPTPISAYLHSAAMVKAGVYLIARLAPAFADVGVWRPLVVTVGLVTMIAGGLRALRPHDLKQLLAFGTISQLGFLVVLFGIGKPAATAAGCALLLAHGLFKAALFAVVGIVDHETHTRDVRELPHLGDGWGPTKWVAVASAASMAGIPPLAGFIAKESAYGALVDGTTGDRLVLAGVVVGSVLTVAYSLRFVAALVRPDAIAPTPSSSRRTSHDGPAPGFLLPGALLVLATVGLGVVPPAWSGFVDRAARALDPAASAHLTLWHGWNAALVLSLVTIGSGVVVFRRRRAVAFVQAALAPRRTGTDVFDAIVRQVLRFAAVVTGVMQSGSLSIYATVILTTAAVAPVTALLLGEWWTGWPAIAGRPIHAAIAAMLVAAAVAATIVRQRFVAAILLGVVGYGMAALFVAQGAPDLALTQFAVETLSVVVFLLVLRQLPRRFEHRPLAIGHFVRLMTSVAVGVLVVLMGIASSTSERAAPVSREMSERALPDGHGRNVVNVILVDIRGIDTLGEITVLVAAGVGITALARAGRTPRRVAPNAPRRRRMREPVER